MEVDESEAESLSCLKETVEITKAAISSSKSPVTADNVADFMQVIYDKLTELAADADKRSE